MTRDQAEAALERIRGLRSSGLAPSPEPIREIERHQWRVIFSDGEAASWELDRSPVDLALIELEVPGASLVVHNAFLTEDGRWESEAGAPAWWPTLCEAVWPRGGWPGVRPGEA